MQIPRHHFQLWIDREGAQGRRLRAGLSGRHQAKAGLFRFPEVELLHLRARHRLDLAATNPYARATWLRTLGGTLFAHLGAVAPFWEPAQPVFLVTVIDSLHQDPRVDDLSAFTPWSRRWLREVGRVHADHLFGLNFVGMIDVAPYVSASRVLGVAHHHDAHLHALVWGLSERQMQRWAERVREGKRSRTGRARRPRSLIPHVTPIKYERIRVGGLRQVLWYVCKTPCKQYQLHVKPNGRVKQWDRTINGINSVRIHKILRRFTLEDLTITGGLGTELLRGTRADIRRRRALRS